MRFKAAESGVGMTFSPLIGVKTPKTRRRDGEERVARVPRFKAEQKTTIIIAMLIIA